MKIEKFEFNKDGLLIGDKKYGLGIYKLEIEDIETINVYISTFSCDNFDNIEGFEKYSNPRDLSKYENIHLIEDKKVGEE